MTLTLLKFDESQARDDSGKWTSGGGGGAPAKEKDPANARADIERHAKVKGPPKNLRELVKFVQHVVAEKNDDILSAVDSHKDVNRAAVKVHEGDLEKGIPTLWALGWEPGQGTDIHDHGESAAAVNVMRGEIGETVFHAPDDYLDKAKGDGLEIREGTHALAKGGTMPVKGRYIHEMSGLRPGRSVTLHAYWPPLSKMRYFVRKGDKLVYDGEWEEGKAPAAGEKTRKAVCCRAVVFKFEESQARDDSGKWTAGGGGPGPSQVSYEAMPGKTTGFLPKLHGATDAEKQEFTRDIHEALHPDGKDVLAEAAGLKVRGDVFGPGFWEGETSPSVQVEFDENMPEAEQVEAIERYAAALGDLLKQEGVGYNRPRADGDSEALNLSLGGTIEPDEIKALAGALKKELGDEANAVVPIASRDGVRLLNFSSKSTDELESLVEKHANFTKRDIASKKYRSSGNVLGNDWKENADGQVYKRRYGGPGGPDLSGTVQRVLRPRIDGAHRKWKERLKALRALVIKRRAEARARTTAALFADEKDPPAEDLRRKALSTSNFPLKPKGMDRAMKLRHWDRVRERALDPAQAIIGDAWIKVKRDIQEDVLNSIMRGKRRPFSRQRATNMAITVLGPAYRKASRLATEHLGIKRWFLDEMVMKKRREEVAIGFQVDRNRIDRIMGTAEERLIRLLEEADAEDLDDEEIGELADEMFDRWVESPAIAQSEASDTVNRSRRDMLETTEYNEWVTAGDHRVRDTHVVYGDAGPQPDGFNYADLTGGDYTLRFPYDPECDEPSEIINCRCVSLPAGAEVD